MKSQNTGLSNKTTFTLGGYLIDTENKTVGNLHYWEEDNIINGERLHSNHMEYRVDTSIDFNTTCLYVFDHNLVFKEHYVPVQSPVKAFSLPAQLL